MGKTLVLFRHGKPLTEGYAEDALRPLADIGKETVKETAQKLIAVNIVPTNIFSSPLLRAEESAKIIADIYAASFECEPALGNNFDTEIILKHLQALPKETTIFLVGHEPTLGRLANDLVGKIVLPDGLSKASACVIEFRDEISLGTGKFIHYYKP